MAYDQKQAARLRRALADRTDIEEKTMFGGLAFMARGRMCCGLVQERLMVRVGPNEYERLLEQPHARSMDFTGRPMRGFLYVEPAGVATAAALRTWVGRALAFAESLPPRKKPKGRATLKR
jgi:TfoX/Sxy family transcriptional regulator of competence genes